MTPPAPPSPEALRTVLDAVGRLVEGVGPAWTAPTPCEGWTVHDLVEHVAGGNLRYAGALAGGEPDQVRAAVGDDVLGPDPVATWRRSTDEVVAAFCEPGVLDRPVTLPLGTVPGVVALHLRLVEGLVHGWDLARALGCRLAVPDDLVAAELAFTGPMLGQLPPGRAPFAPARPVADDAPVLDRLVALLGRDPAWRH